MTFLRAGSIRIYSSVEGTGIPPGIEDYPFQQLAIETEAYDYDWLWLARWAADHVFNGDGGPARSAGDWKHLTLTPLGTPVAQLTREGHDMLASPCGLCQRNITACICDKTAEAT